MMSEDDTDEIDHDLDRSHLGLNRPTPAADVRR